jgi:glycosyltransferase involved in cell wall biosynthesis
MPEFDRESGSGRIYDFILFLRDAGWKVTFVSRHAIGPPDRYVRLLQESGVVALPAQGDDISQLIRSERFDLALLAFWKIGELYGPQLRELSPHTKVIADSVDVHFVRHARQAFMRPADGTRPGLLDVSAGYEFIRELNTYAAADISLTVSDKEADLLNGLLGDAANANVAPDSEDLALSPRPFAERTGLVFVGNFRHAPNVDAVRHLCRDIVPRLPAKVLEAHPLYIVGNAVNDDVREAVEGLPSVRLVGWVPRLTPYLEQARVAIVPLRYGAGTKRKLVQSLMMGTPSVSTTIGIEGLALEDGEHVLVADDPDQFAAAIVRLLKDEALWRRLVSNGRSHVLATHGREVARRQFSLVVETAMASTAERPRLPVGRADERRGEGERRYGELVERIRTVVDSILPKDAFVVVISKGDEALLQLGGRQGRHFPQTSDGAYAGHYPSDDAAAIAHLEALRERGAQYLLVPATGLWWLDHYQGFRLHLEQHHRLVCDRRDTCLVFALSEAAASGVRSDVSAAGLEPTAEATKAGGQDTFDVELRRPVLVPVPKRIARDRPERAESVLVLGVYLASKPNAVEDIVACLSESRRHRVRQKWIALGGDPPSAAVAAVTVDRVDTFTPKFHLVNNLLAREDLSRYQYVMLVDDDIVFPRGFVDRFVALQRHLGFGLAQPARTSRSFIDHPIVEQQRGSIARQTLFVEIGPVVSFHRSVFDLVFPFDLTSPMGWGYENVWSARLTSQGLTMGIIDAVPVDHSLRPPVAHYRWADADQGRTALLRKHDAPPIDECFRVLRVFTASEMADAKTSDQAIN